MKKGTPEDPKGLIFESYQIEGITKSECRTIFLDWALSLPIGQDTHKTLHALLIRYQPDWPDHPMTEVLEEGQTTMTTPKRRGGWRARERDS